MHIKYKYFTFLIYGLFAIILFCSCYKEQSFPVKADFSVEIPHNDYAVLVRVKITNNTTGAETYNWQMTGANPATALIKDVGTIQYNTLGIYTIKLEAGNQYGGKDTATIELQIDAAIHIRYTVSNMASNYPDATVQINNTTIGATTYKWTFEGATPSSSAIITPSAVYNAAGTYTVSLTAGNDKKSITSTKAITLLPNSNLFKFSDVRLGINTAQNSIGSYFSSVLGQVIKSNDITAANGSKIDFAYFGLNNTFSYNKFLSPDSVQHFTFSAIPGATTTKIINKQEACGCSSSLTAAQFDAMSNDALLQSNSINQTGAGLAQFNNTTIPRITLFKTQDGRKGAVKIKQFVDMG